MTYRAQDRARGDDGEALTTQHLDALASDGWVVLHDLPLAKGRTANIDHVCIGPGGVWVVETKSYAGELTYDEGSRKLSVGGEDRTHKLWRAAVTPGQAMRLIPALDAIRASVRVVVVLHVDPELEELLRVGRFKGHVPVGGPAAVVELIGGSILAQSSRKILGRDRLGARAVRELAGIIPASLPHVDLVGGRGPTAGRGPIAAVCPHCGEDTRKAAPQEPPKRSNGRSGHQDTGTLVPGPGARTDGRGIDLLKHEGPPKSGGPRSEDATSTSTLPVAGDELIGA